MAVPVKELTHAQALMEKVRAGLALKAAGKPHGLTKAEVDEYLAYEMEGTVYPSDLPLEDERNRRLALRSPSYLATELVDTFYKDEFERMHYHCMDDVMAPYIRGDDVMLDGARFDPKDYLGFVVLFSRDTFKSSMMWLMLLWSYIYYKLERKQDARCMYVHQVIKKAVKRGENVRNQARHNNRFRAAFPEFRAPVGEWDTKEEWNWPHYGAHGAGECSFTAYGETSEKTGGHYTVRFVDDWETEHLKTDSSRNDNFDAFRGMGPLKDRTSTFNPYLIAGTTYHYEGTHERLVKNGGYLVWKVPAHRGSPKALFDLCALNPRDPVELGKINRGVKHLEATRSDDLNFPKRLPWAQLYQDAREQGPMIFNAQMLQNPVPEGEQSFDIEALDESWVDEIPSPHEMWLYIRCDPAISQKKSADYTAYVVGGVKWNGDRYFIDGWMGRERQPSEIVAKGFTLARKWMANRPDGSPGYTVKSIGWEAVQYQRGLVNMARHGVPERAATHDGESVPMLTRPCPVVAIERSPDVSKKERIVSMDGPISRRQLKFWRKNPLAKRAMQQFKNFPHDRFDILDAMHDLWIRTSTPPLSVEPERPPLHPELMKLLKQGKHGPGTVGTSNTVRLTAWG